jgi:hypothetical protein
MFQYKLMHCDKIMMMWKIKMKTTIWYWLGFNDYQTKMQMNFKLFVIIMKQ